MFDKESEIQYNTTRVIARCTMILNVNRILHTPGARGGRYLALFTGINVLFLALLFALAAWLLHTL